MKRLIILISLILITPAAFAATQFDFLLSQVRSGSTSLANGKVYFYAAGTSTPKTVWLDVNGTTPAANPYTLDANGTAQVYGNGLYRVIVKDSTGVAKFDRDNVAVGVPANITNQVIYPADVIAKGPVVDVRAPSFAGGAKCDGTTDDTAAWNAAIAYAVASPNSRVIRFAGRSKVTSTLQINARGLQIVGDQGGDATGDSVSSIEYYGTGAAIQMGTDDGFAWDGTDLVAHPRSLYNGYQGFTLRNMRLRYAGSATTPLLNGLGAYGIGTYGLRDWRGGLVMLDNVDIVGFEYGFWGVQSDVDTWEKVILANNHVGAFFGPRSDQFTFNTGWTMGNDTSIVFDGAWSAEIHHVTSDNDGSATTSPYSLQANYSRSTGHIIFDDCWFENYGGYDGVIPSFVDAGVNATYKVRNVQFRSPHIITGVSPATPHTSYLATLGNVEDVVITDPYGRPDSGSLSTDSLLNFVGSTSPNSILVRYGSIAIGTPYVNSGTGNPSVTFVQTKSAASGYGGMSLIGQSAITTDGNNVPQIRLNDSDNAAASTHIRSNYDGANGNYFSIDPAPATSAGTSDIRLFRNLNAATAKVTVYKGDGTGVTNITLNGSNGNVSAASLTATGGGAAVTGQAVISTDGNITPQLKLSDSDNTNSMTNIRSNYDDANGTMLSLDPVPATSAGISNIRLFRNTTAATARLDIYKGDGSGTANITLNGSTGNLSAVTLTSTTGGSANHAICWKADGKTLGYCSAVVAADGTCGTCQ